MSYRPSRPPSRAPVLARPATGLTALLAVLLARLAPARWPGTARQDIHIWILAR